MSLAPDVDPAGSRRAEGIVSQLPDDTADNEPRGGRPDPPSPRDGEDNAEGGGCSCGFRQHETRFFSGAVCEIHYSTTATEKWSLSYLAGAYRTGLEELVIFIFCERVVSFCCSVLSFTHPASPLFFSYFRIIVMAVFVGNEENLGAIPGSTPLSPGVLAQFDCHLIAEVENRTVQSIETGMLAFYVVR